MGCTCVGRGAARPREADAPVRFRQTRDTGGRRGRTLAREQRARARAGEGARAVHHPARGEGCVDLDRVVMILPQVHLRKPCYDFTFL